MPVLDNPRHEAFAQHYAKTGNGAQAYVNAGYSKTGANANAARLIAFDSIRNRVAELQAEIAAGTIKLSITDRNARVQALQDRWDRLNAVMLARAQDESTADAPGGETGLLVRTLKVIGYGESAQIVNEYAIDTGLLKELRATEEQAAKELGQRTEKREISGPDGGPIPIESIALAELLTPDELAALESRLDAKRGGDLGSGEAVPAAE